MYGELPGVIDRHSLMNAGSEPQHHQPSSRGKVKGILGVSWSRLMLGDDFAFICGHGPTSTIGRERASNPFLV